MGPTSYRLTSISFHVSRRSHSWDMALSKSDLENSTSRSGLRSKVKAHSWLSNHSMTFLFYVNRPAITTIWPVGCSTHCHQYGRQTFSTHIYIYIYHVRSQGNKVFSGMWESVSLTPVVWWWNWTENKKSPWLAGVTSIISFIAQIQKIWHEWYMSQMILANTETALFLFISDIDSHWRQWPCVISLF